MKKIIAFLVAIFMFSNIQAFASNIEIQPTFYSKSNAQDRLWVGSLQLVWNDFINRIVHNPVRFREGTPTMINELNRQSFTANNISEENYYKYAGKVKKNTKRIISRNIRRKFHTSSDILDKLDLTPRNDMYLVYAMLYKDFEFVKSFDKLGHSTFGLNDISEYFGIGENSDNRLGEGVKVLFYNDPADYAVMLATTGNDEVFLYRNSSNKPFNYIYDDMRKKQRAFQGNKEFKKIDELKIPTITLFEEKNYEELTNRRIMGTNMVINQVLQSVKFDMNEKGVKLKDETGLTVEVTTLLPPEELVPRHFYFDDTFVIFLKEKGKSKPYFALRVNDIKKFQKN